MAGYGMFEDFDGENKASHYATSDDIKVYPVQFGKFTVLDRDRREVGELDSCIRRTSRCNVLENKWKTNLRHEHVAITRRGLYRHRHCLLTLFEKEVNGKLQRGAVQYDNQNRVVGVHSETVVAKWANNEDYIDKKVWKVVCDANGCIVDIRHKDELPETKYDSNRITEKTTCAEFEKYLAEVVELFDAKVDDEYLQCAITYSKWDGSYDSANFVVAELMTVVYWHIPVSVYMTTVKELHNSKDDEVLMAFRSKQRPDWAFHLRIQKLLYEKKRDEVEKLTENMQEAFFKRIYYGDECDNGSTDNKSDDNGSTDNLEEKREKLEQLEKCEQKKKEAKEFLNSIIDSTRRRLTCTVDLNPVLEHYKKSSKETGKNIMDLVRNDLLSVVSNSTKDLDTLFKTMMKE